MARAVAVDLAVRELSQILARGFLRMAESWRNFAVSGATKQPDCLDVFPKAPPDVGGNEAA